MMMVVHVLYFELPKVTDSHKTLEIRLGLVKYEF